MPVETESTGLKGKLTATVADPGSDPTVTNNVQRGWFPNFYDSAKNTINGESVTINAPVIMQTGGSASKVVCFKADAKTLGYCSTQPDSTGSCTCN